MVFSAKASGDIRVFLMKVSMYIVKKWLGKYSPEAHISKGEQEIIGVRYFTDDTPLKKEFLYIGNNKDFIETDRRGVICANSGDIILLDTEDIYEVFNEMQEMLEFYNEWEMQIMRLIEESASVTEILEATMRMLGYGLVLTDASHFMLGEVQMDERRRTYRLPGGRLSDDTITQINQVLKEHVNDRLPFPGPRDDELDLVRNFFEGDVVIGWLVVLDIEQEPDREALNQLTESFCRLLEFWFRINKDSLQLSNQAGVFSDILEGKETDADRILDRINGIGWTGKPKMQLAKITFSEENLFNRTYLIRTIPSTFAGSYVFRFQDDLLMIINLSYPRSGKHEMDYTKELEAFAGRYRASIGLSYPFYDAQNLLNYYEQTNIALQFGGSETGKVYLCKDYAIAYLKSVLRNNLRTDISHQSLDLLVAHDARKGTEYYHTLGTYLIMNCDQTRCAEALHIHRNSLIYRINRIQELLDIDLNDDRLRFYILMSYFIKEDRFGM